MLDRLAAKLTAARLNREDGVTAIEYGLIAALIALVIILAVTTLGGNLRDVFQNIADQVPGSQTN